MAGSPDRVVLPLIPLPRDTVLLPGLTLNIPISGRSDVPSLLSSIYTKATTPKTDIKSVAVGCIPLCSPLLSHEGQQLLQDSELRVRKTAENLVNPSQAGQGDIFGYGVMAKISGVVGRKPLDLTLVVEGIRRFRLERFTQFKPFTEAEVTYVHEEAIQPGDSESQALFSQLKQQLLELLPLIRVTSLLPGSKPLLSPLVARRLTNFISKKDFRDAALLADLSTTLAETTFEEKLRILAALEIKPRMQLALEILERQANNIKNNFSITQFSTKVETPGEPFDISKLIPGQRGIITQDMLRRGLGGRMPPGFPAGTGGMGGDGDDEGQDEIKELKQKLADAKLSPEAQKVADKEVKRLSKMNPAQAEYGVTRTYLETLAEIPWTRVTEDKLGIGTLKRAKEQLDDDHYGLEKIKKRLLEYLAVLKLKQAVNENIEIEIKRATERAGAQPTGQRDGADALRQSNEAVKQVQILQGRRQVDKSPILLLVGPPGTGKTSLAKSVATSLGRKFHRISLGGVRDEAEIRGHRRTYVAAMPGMIVNGLRKVGVANPVFLLDEVDKVGMSNFHGDPSAAMLEVLDPEQNYTFVDHYVNIPIDLSKVLFIATANTLDTIPAPLLDRMETIQLSGYTTVEKRHIANRHLIPKQISSNGLSVEDLELPADVLDMIITSYTREAGVRNLEREIGSVCRYKAVEYAEARDSPDPKKPYSPDVKIADLEDILGTEKFDEEIAASSAVPGVVTGLVAYSYGSQGSILFIEVADMPGSGRVQLTGKLGDVLKESVEVALSWVKAHSYDLNLTADEGEDIMHSRSIHVHCPSGAIPKDGPSAGLAHTIALVSLFSGRPVPPTLAMTGEVSLRGRVMPVGGIKEKLIGAHRAGVKTVLLPKGNVKDVKDVPEEVKRELEIVHVQGIWEALKIVWPDVSWRGWERSLGTEQRL